MLFWLRLTWSSSRSCLRARVGTWEEEEGEGDDDGDNDDDEEEEVHLHELVVGEHEVVEGAGQGGQAVGPEGLQACGARCRWLLALIVKVN